MPTTNPAQDHRSPPLLPDHIPLNILLTIPPPRSSSSKYANTVALVSYFDTKHAEQGIYRVGGSRENLCNGRRGCGRSSWRMDGASGLGSVRSEAKGIIRTGAERNDLILRGCPMLETVCLCSSVSRASSS